MLFIFYNISNNSQYDNYKIIHINIRNIGMHLYLMWYTSLMTPFEEQYMSTIRNNIAFCNADMNT